METALTILVIAVAVAILVGTVLAVVVYRRIRKTQDVVVNQMFQHAKGFDEDFFAEFDSPAPRRVKR
jgi:hypothetical protein